MSQPPSPERWANDLSLILNAVLGPDRFPVNVPLVAKEFTANRYPDDPITLVKGDSLPGFDGALFRAPPGKKGWGIFYNSAITSAGRISFTLAHEFGHYLLHRLAHPNGFRCGEQDIVRWDSDYARLEQQANAFAANLLMPLDDFRRQIDARARADLDMISGCAERYRVSLIAAALRWLQYTNCRAVIVVSRDGYILWSRASEPALKSGAFFRTSRGPIEVPAASLVARQDFLVGRPHGLEPASGHLVQRGGSRDDHLCRAIRLRCHAPASPRRASLRCVRHRADGGCIRPVRVLTMSVSCMSAFDRLRTRFHKKPYANTFLSILTAAGWPRKSGIVAVARVGCRSRHHRPAHSARITIKPHDELTLLRGHAVKGSTRSHRPSEAPVSC